MEHPTIPTPTVCSTVTTSSISAQAPPPTPFQILEICLISAQDLIPINKSMRTYAVAWIQPNKKQTSKTVHQGHTNPTWNEKLAFRVDNQTVMSETAMMTVEIYTISWFRDVLVGTVRVLMSDLITPAARTGQNHLKNTRFIALQVRRPSGNPQGILNMGVTLLDSTMRSMPLRNHSPVDENFIDTIEKKVNSLSKKIEHQEEDHEKTKIHLWRSLSVGSELNNDEFPQKAGSVYNGSMVNGSLVNGSELCSDIGPSASIVAAELARKTQPPQPPTAKPANAKKLIRNIQTEETGSSILEDLTIEEAKAKGYRNITTTRDRWRKEMSMKGKNNFSDDNFDGGSEMSNDSRHCRRNSDGGLFSCFGNAYGIEFTIVCGASNNTAASSINNSTNNEKSRRKKPSEANSA